MTIDSTATLNITVGSGYTELIANNQEFVLAIATGNIIGQFEKIGWSGAPESFVFSVSTRNVNSQTELVVTALFVNQAPTFGISTSSIGVDEGGGRVTVNNFITNVSAVESNQTVDTVTLNISLDDYALFAVLPSDGRCNARCGVCGNR
jgi:hypothetical protein